jgi:hypothetical protein
MTCAKSVTLPRPRCGYLPLIRISNSPGSLNEHPRAWRSAEGPCADFHKPRLRKHTLLPRSALTCRDSKISLSMSARVSVVGSGGVPAAGRRSVTALWWPASSGMPARCSPVRYSMQATSWRFGSGNRMMVNVLPSAACPPYRNGITWRVRLGSPIRPVSRPVRWTRASRPAAKKTEGRLSRSRLWRRSVRQ